MISTWEEKIEKELARKVAYIERMKGELTRIHKEMSEAFKSSNMMLEELQDSVDAMTPMRWQEITEIVCREFSLDPKLLRGHDNSARIAEARHTTQYVLREVLGMTYAEIGKRTGNMHHTSVVHGIEKVENQRLADAGYDVKIRRILGKAHRDDKLAPEVSVAEAMTQ